MNCSDCSIILVRNRGSGVCRPCYVRRVCARKKHPSKKCIDCGGDVSCRSKREQCRPCYVKWYSSIPENRARKCEIGKAWAKANPDRHREKSTLWQKAHPARVKEIRHKTMTGLKNRFTRAKWSAKRRGLSWSITPKQLEDLRTNPCTYCGLPLSALGSGLDRVVSTLGYDEGNVVPCCGKCNRIKGDALTFEEMKVAMQAVVGLRNRKTS